jgi:hypothetical protein
MRDEEELYDYYFSDDLLSRFSKRFGMNKAVDDFISSVEGKSPKEINSIAQEALGRYLQELSMSLVKAEKDSIEHTGEITYQVAEKTGIRFPSVPQRLLELGFMSTRPLDRLSVIESNPKTLVLRIPTCTAYAEIKQRLGEEKTKDLPCRYGCLANSKMLFDQLGIATQSKMTAKANEKGFCEFTFNSEEERS